MIIGRKVIHIGSGLIFITSILFILPEVMPYIANLVVKNIWQIVTFIAIFLALFYVYYKQKTGKRQERIMKTQATKRLEMAIWNATKDKD